MCWKFQKIKLYKALAAIMPHQWLFILSSGRFGGCTQAGSAGAYLLGRDFCPASPLEAKRGREKNGAGACR